MQAQKQSDMWQPHSMGLFDGLKLKMSDVLIDMTINYLGYNFSKEKLVNFHP